MAKTKVSEWSSTPGANTDIDGINLAEGMLPSDVNNAMREMMSQLKDLQSANPTYYTSNSDAIAVGAGGTGAITAAAARTNLGLAIGTNVMAYVAPSTSGNVLTSNGTSWISSALSTGVTSFSAGTTGLTPSTGTTGAVTLDGTLAIANGGTNNGALAVTAGGFLQTDGSKVTNSGAITSGYAMLGGGTGVPTGVAPSTSGNVLTSNGSTWVSQAIATGGFTLLGTGTTTSGTSVSITGLNLTGYRQVCILFNNIGGIASSGSSNGISLNGFNYFGVKASSTQSYLNGEIYIDLAAGDNIAGSFVFGTTSNPTNITMTSLPYQRNTSLTSSATSVTIACVNTFVFNAGSFTVYGIK